MRWKCTVCGQIFEGDRPPVPCPVCGAGEDAFVCLDQPSSSQWRCQVCGQIFDGATPPIPCPICGAGRDAFTPVIAEQMHFRKDTQEHFVVLGGGAAGLSAAKAIRSRNETANITLVCGESVLPYNRPALSDVIADGYSFRNILLEDATYYERAHINLLTDGPAKFINPATQTVTLANGENLFYDKLCLATGAVAFNPLGVGCAETPVYALRTFADAQAIISSCRGKRVLVVGGGILGLEAAVALREREAQVTVVELAQRILSLQADEVVSTRLTHALTRLGLSIRTGCSVKAVDTQGALLSDGNRIDADLIVVSIGIRSETTLARAASLRVVRGIVVDDRMQTSDPHIWAAGDCAQYAECVSGLWSTALAQGETAGACMADDPEARYMPTVPATAFETVGISLFSAGRLQGESMQTLLYEDAYSDIYRKLAFEHGSLCGVLCWGDTAQSGTALRLLSQNTSMGEAATRLFA